MRQGEEGSASLYVYLLTRLKYPGVSSVSVNMETWWLAVLTMLVFVGADHPPPPAYPHIPPRRGVAEATRQDTMNASRRQSDVGSFRILNSAGSSVTINLDSQTSLYVQSGQTATLYLDVINNNNYNAFFYFYCDSTTSTLQTIQPNQAWITGLGRLVVKVTLRITSSSTDTITFTAATVTAFGEDPTFFRAYLYVGQQVSDSTDPGVSYTINGDCQDHDTPSTCAASTWGFTATIKDSNSGLLSVETVPPGFVFTTEFIAGTKTEVSGRYSASCCLNKADFIATDLNGNQYKTSIDIYNVWLSVAAISAIVLGCVLLLVLLILLCVAIVICVRRRRKTTWIRDP